MPPTTARRRSMICAGPVIQPAAPILNPASAAEEDSVMRTICWMLPDNRSPIPSGDRQNITGTTKAGSVYFQAFIGRAARPLLPVIKRDAGDATGDEPEKGRDRQSVADEIKGERHGKCDGGSRQSEEPLLRPDHAEDDGDDDRPEDGKEGAHAEEEQHRDRGQRQEMIALRARQHP